MALAVISSGTTTPGTLGVEEDLDASDTSGKTYVLVVDTANLTGSELLELRLYTKVLSGGTSRLAYTATFVGVQGEPIKYSVPVPANIEIRATIEQTGGTLRAFPWALLSID